MLTYETEVFIEDLDLSVGKHCVLHAADFVALIEVSPDSDCDPREGATANIYDIEVTKCYLSSGKEYTSESKAHLDRVAKHLEKIGWAGDNDEWALESVGDWEDDLYEEEMERRAAVAKERGR